MYVLGTAGHVDHGKSTLIERITGIDPDRLAEEKERGLTIDLGFAWLTLPSGREVGIVDVPGHERFVSNMLAGAGSIDATIFVVAANEGWKPQSEEHLAILDLLGARGGVVALTKSDLVDGDEVAAISRTIGARLAGTVLEGARIVPVSAATGAGIDELLAAVDLMLDGVAAGADRERARLFVDRSFSIKGAGTVVTGTLTGGRLRVEDEVQILPAGLAGRIRSIQTHKHRRDEAEPGSRVALNIAGIDRSQVARGDAVVHPGRWRASTLLDVSIRAVRGVDHAAGPRAAYKLHLGSAEVDARLRLFGAKELTEGEEAFGRLTLAGDVVADPFDRFVLRDSGRQQTVAGGVVLDAHPRAGRLAGADIERRIALLKARRAAGPDGLAAAIVAERGVIPVDDLIWLSGGSMSVSPVRGYAVSPEWLSDATASLVDALQTFHRANPLARGMPRDDARAGAKINDPKVFSALVEALPELVTAEGTLLRTTDHRVTLSPEHQAARDRLVAALEAAALAPPPLADLATTHGQALIQALVDAGEIVKITSEIGFAFGAYERAKSAIAGIIDAEGPSTASRFREALGTSRKYLIPLLEHLDASGFTKRQGDLRVRGEAR